MQNEPEEYKIFVGGLRDVEEDEFVEAFEQFGDVITCSFRSRRSFGFVSYRRKEDAENAIVSMNGEFLGWNTVRVEWADGYSPSVIQETTDDYETVFNMTCANNRTVHLKGLKSDTTDELLESIFSPFGEIEDISLHTPFSDYAFIKFNSKEAATLAICSINNTEIGGSNVKCSWSYRPDCERDIRLDIERDIRPGIERNIADFFLGGIRAMSSCESSSGSSSSSSSSLEPGDEFDRIFNETTSNNRTVYCGGLVHSVTNELLEQIFSPFGIVESIKLFNERSDYGFIRFNTKEAAALAICSIDGTQINGSTVKCNWSYREVVSSPERQSSESSPESSLTSISHLSDRLNRISTQFGLDIPGAAAAAASAPLTEDESQAAAKPREIKMDILCKICMDEEMGVVFVPCGHLTSCTKCAKQISTCPVCRRRITSTVRTYLT